MDPKPRAGASTLSIEEALEGSPALARLSRRLRDSKARFALIHPLLPEPLARHVKPGPVDDEGWSLLAANAAVASKLRHLQPRLESALLAAGWQVSSIRVRIESAAGNGL